MQRALQFLTVGWLCLTPCLSFAAPANADDRLQVFFQRYLDARFQLLPLEATRLGDHRFDAQLEDLSADARARVRDLEQRTLAELPRAVEIAALSADGRIDFEILRQELERSLWLDANTDPWASDPRRYNDYITDSVYLLLAQSTQPVETNVANAVARMARIPQVIAAAKANLGRPPRTHTETAIRQNQGAIAFYENGLATVAGRTRQLGALQEAGRQVAAALREYQAWLEQDLRPRADGEWRLGREKFGHKLELELDAGMSADQVYADAEREYARVEAEMYVVARQLWSRYFPGRTLPADDAEGRRATVQAVIGAVGREHSEVGRLTRDVRRTVREARAFIRSRDVLRLPEPDRCAVVEMPEFKRGNSTAYLESAPPLDPLARSFYAVSPPPGDWPAERVTSYLEEYNSRMLHILTIHEAYPGHYVQLEYSNRHPSPIRRVLQSGVFIEGWAVYTEQTLLDEGYGGGDLALRLMQLKFYLRAVVNTLLDHRMHCDGMTEDAAMRLLVDGAYQTEGEARLKVIRAQQSSVQLSTYFVGRMAHYRLRQAIQREQGDAFHLGRYHEAVLAHGSVPVKFLPELVRRRLAQPR